MEMPYSNAPRRTAIAPFTHVSTRTVGLNATDTVVTPPPTTCHHHVPATTGLTAGAPLTVTTAADAHEGMRRDTLVAEPAVTVTTASSPNG